MYWIFYEAEYEVMVVQGNLGFIIRSGRRTNSNRKLQTYDSSSKFGFSGHLN